MENTIFYEYEGILKIIHDNDDDIMPIAIKVEEKEYWLYLSQLNELIKTLSKVRDYIEERKLDKVINDED